MLLLLLVTIKPNKSFQFNKYLSGMCHGPLPPRQMTIIMVVVVSLAPGHRVRGHCDSGGHVTDPRAMRGHGNWHEDIKNDYSNMSKSLQYHNYNNFSKKG